ncbi:hypothetical protein C8Q78DRAFT_971657 [Trametes maxima]|nr:hypothetical protein C8Q78DRAFT_971657 [Trametes maxima]
MSLENPPWYSKDPVTGKINVLSVPERLRTHPDLLRRGIILTDFVKPGIVYKTSTVQQPQYVVKILSTDTEELGIYKRLTPLIPSPSNHTVPSELSQCGHPLLIMPYLWGPIILRRRPDIKPITTTLHEMLGLFVQLVEGVEFLHRQHIAHMDLCTGNILVAGPDDAKAHPRLVSEKLYIVDFGSSQQLKLGPGVQGAIVLPPSQQDPPNGIKHFDPYSWDVYCLGHVLRDIMHMNYDEPHSPLARLLTQWLISKERGCTGICRCRPSARAALVVLKALRLIVYASTLSMHSARALRKALRKLVFTR